MNIRIPTLIKDPVTTEFLELEAVEFVTIKDEDFFLDGPVSKRVAVLDFDPRSGALLPGAKFRPPAGKQKFGGYEIKDEGRINRPGFDLHAPDFNQVSVFGTVLKTMYMFEEPDTLGRPLTWGFDAPQLLVVPRAGRWNNAFYERDSHSLQFFFFESARRPGEMIQTSLSHDIVSHETGHAILDGIAPDLYSAVSPQSLALHEAVADLTALMMSFRCEPLARAALHRKGGSIQDSHAFSGIAEEFAFESDPHGRSIFLRNLLNDKNLDPKSPDRVARDEPHQLSEVLSGALYSVMLRIFERLKGEYMSPPPAGSAARPIPKAQVPFRALLDGSRRFKRMIFRALDYLPLGEVSFADYARAIIAADQASHPNDGAERELIREEFVRRRMVPNKRALEVKTNFEHPAVEGLDLQALVDSDWVAYEFANNNRRLLGIPDGVHFRVRPRLDTTKRYFLEGGPAMIRECIFKVSWDHKEANRLGGLFPRERQITVGTTLAIDWETRKVRALLTSDYGNARQQDDRDLMLTRLAGDGLLRLGNEAVGPDGKPLSTAIRAEATDGVMRVRGTSRMLHIAAGEV